MATVEYAGRSGLLVRIPRILMPSAPIWLSRVRARLMSAMPVSATSSSQRASAGHPQISLSSLVFVFGFVYDFAMEQLCVRVGLYTFTQVIPFGSVFTGTRWQFPLLWQSSLISILMIPAAALIYRDVAAVPLPLWDPVRLAEEISVLDLISGGRVSYAFGVGHREEEYIHFGVEMAARGRLADEYLGVLIGLVRGESADFRGRRVRVSPRSHHPTGLR
jgi:Spirocyclase AveC-like/Luciferase-like monooxygenase